MYLISLKRVQIYIYFFRKFQNVIGGLAITFGKFFFLRINKNKKSKRKKKKNYNFFISHGFFL